MQPFYFYTPTHCENLKHTGSLIKVLRTCWHIWGRKNLGEWLTLTKYKQSSNHHHLSPVNWAAIAASCSIGLKICMLIISSISSLSYIFFQHNLFLHHHHYSTPKFLISVFSHFPHLEVLYPYLTLFLSITINLSPFPLSNPSTPIFQSAPHCYYRRDCTLY